MHMVNGLFRGQMDNQMSYEIRNDKLLREAYEAGRRQALSEDILPGHLNVPPEFRVGMEWDGVRWKKIVPKRPSFTPNNPMTAKNALWKKIIDAHRAGDRTLLKTLLKQAVKAGYITGAVATQLLGAGTFAAFLALLIPLGLLA